MNDIDKYNAWRLLAIERMQQKLKNNVDKRTAKFKEVVEGSVKRVLKIISDLNIEDNVFPIKPAEFRIDHALTSNALCEMNGRLEAYPGVAIQQCQKKPSQFKEYWRIADNWWNRQKGKHFGDYLFYPILKVIEIYCRRLLAKYVLYYDLLHFEILQDVMYEKVSFERARPTPLIFDLALATSTKLKSYFRKLGDTHGEQWIIPNNKKQLREAAKKWVTNIKDQKYKKLIDLLRPVHIDNANNNNNSTTIPGPLSPVNDNFGNLNSGHYNNDYRRQYSNLDQSYEDLRRLCEYQNEQLQQVRQMLHQQRNERIQYQQMQQMQQHLQYAPHEQYPQHDTMDDHKHQNINQPELPLPPVRLPVILAEEANDGSRQLLRNTLPIPQRRVRRNSYVNISRVFQNHSYQPHFMNNHDVLSRNSSIPSLHTIRTGVTNHSSQSVSNHPPLSTPNTVFSSGTDVTSVHTTNAVGDANNYVNHQQQQQLPENTSVNHQLSLQHVQQQQQQQQQPQQQPQQPYYVEQNPNHNGYITNGNGTGHNNNQYAHIDHNNGIVPLYQNNDFGYNLNNNNAPQPEYMNNMMNDQNAFINHNNNNNEWNNSAIYQSNIDNNDILTNDYVDNINNYNDINHFESNSNNNNVQNLSGSPIERYGALYSAQNMSDEEFATDLANTILSSVGNSGRLNSVSNGNAMSTSIVGSNAMSTSNVDCNGMSQSNVSAYGSNDNQPEQSREIICRKCGHNNSHLKDIHLSLFWKCENCQEEGLYEFE